MFDTIDPCVLNYGIVFSINALVTYASDLKIYGNTNKETSDVSQVFL